MITKERGKKAIFFSTDVLIASIIIFLSILFIIPFIKYSSHKTEMPQDLIEVLSSLENKDINNSYIKELIAQKKITDLNKSLIEQIGEFYVTNLTIAENITKSIISDMDIVENIGIWYGNTLLASKNSSPYETSENVEVNRQIISGIKKGESVTGFSARAFFSQDVRAEYFYFGGYVGEGNISARIEFYGEISSIKIELVTNKDFDVYVNGNYSGHYQNSSSEFQPANYDISAYISNFHSGVNIIKFSSENFNIGGGYIKIMYENSTSFEEKPTRHYFPGIEGLINLYDGAYIPGLLNSMDIFLHLDTGYITFLVLGNTTVFRNKTNGEENITISNQELINRINMSGFNYSDFIGRTFPLRLGMENVSYVSNLSGNADVFSVTDLSGSMSGSKIENAIAANNALIDAVLNVSGNRVGLVGYRSTASDSDFHPLSYDKTSLKAEVNSWYALGGTCICCGINKAINNSEGSMNLINSKESWKVSNETYAGWTNITFDDSSWEEKQMPYFLDSYGNIYDYNIYNSEQWACEKINNLNPPLNNTDCTSYAYSGDYNNISLSNDLRWSTSGDQILGYYESQIYQFNISNLSELLFSWEGHDTVSTEGYDTKIHIWNFSSNSWDFKEKREFSEPNDEIISFKISEISDYIYNGKISFLASHQSFSGSSCPYIYSWNGSEYIFDSEGLTSYSLFKEFEGKQPSKLYNFKPNANEYKILIKEILDEDSFIDSAELIKISHPKNVEIYPVMNRHQKLYNGFFKNIPMKYIYSGRKLYNKLSDKFNIAPDIIYSFDSVKELKKPISAIDSNGNVKSILKEDDIFWNSKPGINKRYVELVYEKPKNVNSAKLLVKYKEDEFLSWLGARMLNSLEKYNIDKDGTRAYNFALNEIAIIFEVWDGKKWVYKGNLLDFPREKPSKAIIPINLKNIKTKDLKIRLSGLPKTLLIDSIFIDYSKSADLSFERIKLKSANMDGKDVKDILKSSDEKRVVLKGKHKDKVELVFDTKNNKVNDLENSFFLNLRGYYIPYKADLDILNNKDYLEKVLKGREKISDKLLSKYLEKIKRHNSLETDYVSLSEVHALTGEWFLRKNFNFNETPVDAVGYIYVDDFAEVYLNGNLIYNSSDKNGNYWDDIFEINLNYFNIGENVIAVKLRNLDSSSGGFDFKLKIQLEEKYNSMIVMSDGWANGQCPEQGTGSALQDAIQAACDAHENKGIAVYAVGFGSGADETTLQAIADCGNGSYYFGDITDIVEIYKQIANEIINASYTEQTISGTGDIVTKLYPDSYIEFNYTKPILPYGLIATAEEKFSNDLYGYFNTPENSTILDAKVISYSGPRWTSKVEVNNKSVYNLSRYGTNFIELGDPYSIHIPTELINNTNTVKLTTGLSPSNSTEGSEYNKIIYEVVKDIDSYSSISSKAEGCKWTLEFEDNTNITKNIPSNYNGSNVCYYITEQRTYDINDAIQTAIYNLLKLLDFDSDNKLDVKFTGQNLEISSSEITGIPYGWSTEVQVRRWY